MGLLARGLELAGIATALTSWSPGITRPTRPPRVTFTRLGKGSTLGNPHDGEQQRRVLKATLDLFQQDAPVNPVRLDEKHHRAPNNRETRP